MEWICKECEADNYLCDCENKLDKRIKELEAELERATKQSTDNPWCADCEQEHCLVDSDGTCAYIRDYHAVKAELTKAKTRIKKLENLIDEDIDKLLAEKGNK